MAEFHIGLGYITMHHTGTENEFLLRIFDRCAAKTHLFSYMKVGGTKMKFMPTPRFGPNGASVHGKYIVLAIYWEKYFGKISLTKHFFTLRNQVEKR